MLTSDLVTGKSGFLLKMNGWVIAMVQRVNADYLVASDKKLIAKPPVAALDVLLKSS